MYSEYVVSISLMLLLVLDQIHIEGVVSHARAGSSPAFGTRQKSL